MSERPHPLFELTRARLLEFVREPEAVFWVFVFPVLLALALGIAFRSRPQDTVRVAVVEDASAAALASALDAGAGIEARVVSPADAAEALRKGRVDLAVEAEGDAAPGALPRRLVCRFDPSRAESRLARLAVETALRRARGLDDGTAVRDEAVDTPGSRYIDFLIPGLVGLNLMGSGMYGVGFVLVVARTRKLLKRFAATPMRRSHYLLSYGLSRLVFLIVEVAAVVGAGWVLFGVAVRGSWLDLALISVLGAGSFVGLGLLIAARTKTIEAASGWMNLIQLPMWLLSGTFFSYERFPESVWPAIRALPLTALNDALRAVTNDGASLASAGVEIVVLLAWGAVSFAIALRIFRWQ
ncbi:MAG: ABC transporter permease [Acidobacteriota bacterium]